MGSELNLNLTRSQVRKALRSVRGSAAQLARELQVSETAVSQVLKGRGKSAAILAAATARALEIIEGRAA